MKWLDGQAYAPYTDWECWQHGLYLPRLQEQEVAAAVGLLGDGSAFYAACRRVLSEWPVSATVHLSDRQRNRNAYLGAAACRLVADATMVETRVAWGRLTSHQQRIANTVARTIAQHWAVTGLPFGRSLPPSAQWAFPFLTPPEPE